MHKRKIELNKPPRNGWGERTKKESGRIAATDSKFYFRFFTNFSCMIRMELGAGMVSVVIFHSDFMFEEWLNIIFEIVSSAQIMDVIFLYLLILL